MGLFSRFTTPSNAPSIAWQHVSDSESANAIVAASHELPVVIFKHSTRCGISGMMLRRFEGTYNIPETAARTIMIDVIKHRDLARSLTQLLGIPHESPQLLCLYQGRLLLHASHGDITAEEVAKAIEQKED